MLRSLNYIFWRILLPIFLSLFCARTSYGRDEDDVALRLPDVRQRLPGEDQRGHVVEVHHPLRLLRGLLGDGGHAQDAGVVHQHVQSYACMVKEQEEAHTLFSGFSVRNSQNGLKLYYFCLILLLLDLSNTELYSDVCRFCFEICSKLSCETATTIESAVLFLPY